MKAKSFWSLMFVSYWIAETLCILIGLRLLGYKGFYVVGSLSFWTMYLGFVIEQWPSTRPGLNDKHWHTEFSLRGAVYVIPPILAIMGVFSPLFVVASAITFLLLVWRLVYVRRCLRPA